MVEDPEAGKIYNGKVTRLTDFGAFIEILPGKEGLCHISKIAKERVQKVSDALKEGQELQYPYTCYHVSLRSKVPSPYC